MIFFICLLAFLYGMISYQVVMFALKAYRRYRYNQERKKYLYTLRRHAEIGNLLSLLEMKKHKNWRN